MRQEYIPAHDIMGQTGLMLDNEEEFFSNFHHEENVHSIDATSVLDFSGPGSSSRSSQLFGSEPLDHHSLVEQTEHYFPPIIGLDSSESIGNNLSSRENPNIYNSLSMPWTMAKEGSESSFDGYQQKEQIKTGWSGQDNIPLTPGEVCCEQIQTEIQTGMPKPASEISETWQPNPALYAIPVGNPVGAYYGAITPSDPKFNEWFSEAPHSIQSDIQNDRQGLGEETVRAKLTVGSSKRLGTREICSTPVQVSSYSHSSPGDKPVETPLLFRARYGFAGSIGISAAGEGIVMPACKKEWFDKLNLPHREVLKGQVQAVGERTTDQGVTQRLMVVEPSLHTVPLIHPLLRVAMSGMFAPGAPKLQPRVVPLGRPCFSPFEPGMLIVGDEVHPVQEASSMLLVASVQRSPTMRIKSVATAPLRNPASALAWLSPSRILVSAGNALIVMKLNDAVLRSRSQLPAFHHDDIRDIQLCPIQTKMCLSGGYDGQVFVTDLERVVSDQLGSVRASQNARYGSIDAVSSVAWNPLMSNLASATCDSGFLHAFDPRVNRERPTIVLATGAERLNTHGWLDAHALLLGYGDGTLRLFDVRRADECVVTFRDPHVHRIGDVVFDPQRRYLVTFGNPRFSVWRVDSQRFTLSYHDPECVSRAQLDSDPDYKLSGAFMLTGGRQHGIFGITDTCGSFSLYDLHSADCPAISIVDSVPPT